MQLAANARTPSWLASAAILLVLAVCGVLPLPSSVQDAFELAMIWGIVGVGLDVLAGYVGQPSFGQAGFVAIGAYAAIDVRTHVASGGTVLGLLAAVTIPTLVAAVLGFAIVRLGHFGMAVSTFFFGFLVLSLLQGTMLGGLTNSETGIPVPPVLVGEVDITNGQTWYFLILVGLAATVVTTTGYVRSIHGSVMRLVKQDELVSVTQGASPIGTRWRALVYTAAAAGLGGFFIGPALGFLTPEAFDPSQSILLFAMLVIGGSGTVVGAILGALFLELLTVVMTPLQRADAIAYAFVFLIFLIVFPGGIVGLFEQFVRAVSLVPGGRSAAEAWQRWQLVHGAPSGHAEDVRSDRREAGRVEAVRVDSPATPVLTVHGLGVRFGGVRALIDVDLTVKQNSMHAVIGPNGAGKTTLLNAVTGLLPGYEGSVVFMGEEVAKLEDIRLRARGLSRTFQNPALVSDLTLFENVLLGRYAYRWQGRRTKRTRLLSRGGDARAACEQALVLVGLPARRWVVPAADLTLAEQKLTDIARAVIGAISGTGHCLLLLDEPTAGLDSADIQRVGDILSRLRASLDLTILVIAHDVKFLRRVADTATALDFGRVIAHGPIEDVLADPTVITAFLGSQSSLEVS